MTRPKVHDPARDADAARAMFAATDEAEANRRARADGTSTPAPLQTITRWALMCEERHNGRTITIHRDRAEALESLIEFLMAGEDPEEDRWQDIPREDLDELTDWCRARAEEQHADFFVDDVVVIL
jgi:hypothetical protein